MAASNAKWSFPLRGTVLAAWLCLRGGGLAQETWAFEPARDEFSPDALLDLRGLNEREAGEKGWIGIDARGDFVAGDGTPIRFWAVNSNVSRDSSDRPLWKEKRPDLARHARWLAKIGVNMTRCHGHINPDLRTQQPTDVNMAECEWIWRTVGAMKKEGIYTTVSPFWARGDDMGRLFFDPGFQACYKEWLRKLFLTPTPHLGGRTLAEEPALAVFQIQNEDSLLFWTVSGFEGEKKRLLGRCFAEWAARRHGSLEKAFAAWGGHREPGDDAEGGVLDLVHIWHATQAAKLTNNKQTPRVTDQVRFFTETMHEFNRMIGKFVREELKCPVLVNAGNWKTADSVLLNDAERYSYTANEVMAVNRYFGGIHKGEHSGWAIVNGDEYASDSALLAAAALEMPLTLKQVAGRPMLVTESAWVFPCEHAAEAPFLVAVYSSLTGCDAYYWFATGSETWTPPQSANGYLPSQGKWICMTPDMGALFPAAALAFRRRHIERGRPVVSEHRSLQAIYERKSPVIAESASFDPNRDAGDQPAASPLKTGVSPYAFYAGPVEVVYDSDESRTRVDPALGKLIRDAGRGKIVAGITGQIVLDTENGFCTVNAPCCQGVAAHFAGRRRFALQDVAVECGNRFGSVMVVSMDDRPLRESRKILVQVGLPCRPTGWRTEPAGIRLENGETVEGKRVLSFGQAPWAVECADVKLRVRNQLVRKAVVLDPNGMRKAELPLENGEFVFPRNAIHVVLQ